MPRLVLLLSLWCGAITAAEIDPGTGLVIAPGFKLVSVHCTVCHSAMLVAQNRADRQGWLQMIRWMQESQGLWPLGDNEQVILDYLAEHYGPQRSGRRRPLAVDLLPPL